MPPDTARRTGPSGCQHGQESPPPTGTRTVLVSLRLILTHPGDRHTGPHGPLQPPPHPPLCKHPPPHGAPQAGLLPRGWGHTLGQMRPSLGRPSPSPAQTLSLALWLHPPDPQGLQDSGGARGSLGCQVGPLGPKSRRLEPGVTARAEVPGSEGLTRPSAPQARPGYPVGLCLACEPGPPLGGHSGDSPLGGSGQAGTLRASGGEQDPGVPRAAEVPLGGLWF